MPKRIYLHKTDSTNKELWRMIDQEIHPEEATVLQAGWQSEGRGQANTTWESKPGENLLFSVLLKPVFLKPSLQFLLNQCIAVSLRAGIAAMCKDHHFVIKWPNDIYVEGRKIAGTLIENRIMGKEISWTVVGIGININQTVFPDDIPHPASLRMLTGGDWDAGSCLDEVMKQLLFHYQKLQSGNIDYVREHYLRHLWGFQNKMHFIREGQSMIATVRGVDENGKLLLENQHGSIKAFDIKEIQFDMRSFAE